MAQEEEIMRLVAKAVKVGVSQAIIKAVKGQKGLLEEAIKEKEYCIGLEERCIGLEEEVSETRQRSIQSTYGSDYNSFKLPELKINKWSPPHNKGKKGDDTAGNEETQGVDNQEVGEDGHDVAKINVAIPDAETRPLPDQHELCVPIEKVKIPPKSSNGKVLLSGLAVTKLDSLGPGMKIEYANEAEVQALCFTLVEDALKVLGLTTEEVRPHLEISIYTMRPDIILVLRREGRIIFAIEVKSPELADGDVFNNGKVSYQLFSYLLALYAMGDKAPMAAIMTYNKIALVTLGAYTDNNEIKVAVQKGTKNFQDGVFFHETPSPEEKEGCSKRDKTPVKQVICYEYKVDTQKQFNEGLTGGEKPGDDQGTNAPAEGEGGAQLELEVADTDGHRRVKPKVFMSEVHKDKHVFPFLLQALQVAYLKGTGVKDECAAVNTNTLLGGRFAFRVSEGAFDWYKLRPTFTAKIDKKAFAYSSNQQYYILGKLGEGKTTSVHMATTSSGNVCAMKIYYMKPSNGSKLAEEKIIEEAENQLKEEKRRWGELYPNFGSRWLWLGGSLCLLMPYGHDLVVSLPNSATDSENKQELDSRVAHHRWRALPKIKSELSRFAATGYKYRESDLRWNHVLKNPIDGKIFLCDLESLVKKESTEDEEEAVWSQLEVLLQPMVTEFEPFEDWLKGKDTTSLTKSLSGDYQEDFKNSVDKKADNRTTKDKVLLFALQYWGNEEETKNDGGSPGSRTSDPSLKSETVDSEGAHQRGPKKQKI